MVDQNLKCGLALRVLGVGGQDKGQGGCGKRREFEGWGLEERGEEIGVGGWVWGFRG